MSGAATRSKAHAFHVEDAELYGVDGAVMLQQISDGGLRGMS